VIKVGFIVPETGTAAAPGQDMIHGWQLWWRQHGYKVDGYTIQTRYYDTGSDPQQALTKARQAVEEDHVQMVVGPYLASEGLAIAPYLEQSHVPFFPITVSANDFTMRQRSPYLIRIAGWSSSQTTMVAGPWAVAHGYKTAVTIGAAYAFGYESVGGFAQTYTSHGGTILDQVWPPLGTMNYAPYLSVVANLHPQMVFVTLAGSDNTRFLQQWKLFGLPKVKVIAQETLTDQSSIRGLPLKDLEGITTFAHYAEGRPDPQTQAFDEIFAKQYHLLPSYMAAAAYTGAEWLDAAFQKVHGNVTNTSAFLAAVRSISFADTPLGPMKLDSYGEPIENVYVRAIEPTPAKYASDATAWNVPVQTYPNVSQFGPYAPAKFLAEPEYSPTYQGISK
jgi:branched-chain amino acid transport system substrate-binding protein